jgi:hypothetical protein
LQKEERRAAAEADRWLKEDGERRLAQLRQAGEEKLARFLAAQRPVAPPLPAERNLDALLSEAEQGGVQRFQEEPHPYLARPTASPESNLHGDVPHRDLLGSDLAHVTAAKIAGRLKAKYTPAHPYQPGVNAPDALHLAQHLSLLSADQLRDLNEGWHFGRRVAQGVNPGQFQHSVHHIRRRLDPQHEAMLGDLTERASHIADIMHGVLGPARRMEQPGAWQRHFHATRWGMELNPPEGGPTLPAEPPAAEPEPADVPRHAG